MTKFSEQMFDYHRAESDFTDKLCDAGWGEYATIGGDYYDCSIEFYKVENDERMPEAAQRILHEAGFFRAFVNHKDGWETHYNWNPKEPFKASRGWRRRYVSDPTVSTTRVAAGPPDPGYFEISYWPEGWDSERTKEWLSSGYMRVVPDPLEVAVTSGVRPMHEGP